MRNLNITPCKQRFNIKNAKKCLAKTRKGTLCQSPAMKNNRCRLHGGKSTGARTKEGLEKVMKANLKSGFYTKEEIANRKILSEVVRTNKSFLKNFD